MQRTDQRSIFGRVRCLVGRLGGEDIGFKYGLTCMLDVMGVESRTEQRQLLACLQSPEALGCLLIAAAVQRSAIDASRQRLTLRQTRRMVPIMFSMMLVQASERRSCSGRPSRITVSISSSPSRMLAATRLSNGAYGTAGSRLPPPLVSSR